MASNTNRKPSISAKPPGKQTTIFGFFQKANAPTTAKDKDKDKEKRVEARPKIPLTPLPSSEVGEEESPNRVPGEKKSNGTGGLRTPITPIAGKRGNEMEVDGQTGSAGSRRVGDPKVDANGQKRLVNYAEDSDESQDEAPKKSRPLFPCNA